MLLLLPLVLPGVTPVLGSSTAILQNLVRGSALKCLADLGGGLRKYQVFVVATCTCTATLHFACSDKPTRFAHDASHHLSSIAFLLTSQLNASNAMSLPSNQSL